MFSFRTTIMNLLLLSGACLLGMVAAGCGDGLGKRYPVEAQVLLDGAPLVGMTGMVMFVPDKSKGNKTPVNPTGQIDNEGRYKLSAKGRPGAPAGWYKVVVSSAPPGTADREMIAEPAIDVRYATEKLTPLEVEVVAEPAPGAYDLKTITTKKDRQQ